MNIPFDPTDTQVMLRDSLARYLADRGDAVNTPVSFTPPVFWRGLARQLGVLGTSFPESLGGLGGDLSDQLVIMEALGEAIAGEPYLSTVVLAGGLLRRVAGEGGSAAAGALIGRIVDGDAIVGFAHDEPGTRPGSNPVGASLLEAGGGWKLSGHKTMVRAAPWATHWLVSARDAAGRLVMVIVEPAAGRITRRDVPTLDGAAASELRFDGSPVAAEAVVRAPSKGVPAEGGLEPILDAVLDEATLAVCAEAIGVMRRLFRETLDYARQRKQFGVPIASFQVLQHRLADMHMALEQAAAIVAVTAAAEGALDPRSVSSAKVAVNRACRVVGQGAVQIHGGMGMTDELAIGHGFKRLTVIESQFGSTDHHLRRVERLMAAHAG